ncbi:alpha/beta hydrolase [Metabacillus iocasae]|uniref:Carboxylesterase n=1 Tax=Priestia iocasae TaxID=2291674 RepID=A0ABS2QYT0_9BACI|nr:alpha/beta fold hydrolase [Metabacillus iocasae]MBM7703624.1 carboxylesterase [Metabacillus iocasae]
MESYKVIDGAESFFIRGNEVGVLVSHGFIGTPQSMKYVGEELAKKGYTVYGLRLKGHGTHYEDLEQATYEDWKQDFLNAYNHLKESCKYIFIVGQSMGGTLTLRTASEVKDIEGIMLINPAISVIPSMESYRQRFEPRYVPEGKPDIKENNVHEITYEQAPLKSIQQLLSLMDETKIRLSRVSCPTLLLTSTIDNVVPPENSTYILNHVRAGHKRQVFLENSYHVASMDYDKDKIVTECITFITQELAKRSCLRAQ